MSPTWIKINTRLARDPRVLTIAAAIAPQAARYILDPTHAKDLFGVTESVTCNALCDVTCAALQRIWVAGNEHTTDGVFKNCSSIAYLDLIAGIHGFGKAMEDVEWAIYDAEAKTITLPNFLEHNSPDKNGHRSRSAGAIRLARFREKQKAEALLKAGEETLQTPLQETERNVSSSISNSLSKSTEGTPSDSELQTGSADLQSAPVPASGNPEMSGHPVNPVQTLAQDPDPLGTLKKRINTLRPAWTKAPHWSGEEEQALFEARQNLFAIEEQDWLILGWFFRWVTTAANTGTQNAVQATTRRHQFVRELASYLDRATTAWKQERCPKLGEATKPAAKPKPKLAPEAAPVGPTDIFRKLASDLGIPARAESPPPASPAPARTLPPPDFDSPAYKALVAAQTPQTTHTAA